MNNVQKFLVIGLLSFGTIAHGDSLFNKRAAESGTLISAKSSRFEVGDIITVLVRESIDASTDSVLDTKKESTQEATADAAANQFLVGKGSSGLGLFPAGALPNWNLESEGEVKSDGTTSRGNSLTMTISCTVTSVNDNGTMMIEGQKNITVNREKSILKVAGTLRARDVGTDNTVQSNQIANSQIQLTGEGPLWNNQRRGLFTKLFDWISPF
jgi:flagellar L-ring protein FlgH